MRSVRDPGLPTTDRETCDHLVALARLIPLWPEDVLDRSEVGRRRLIGKLERGLRAEQRRARSGSHAYDFARHAQLARALRRERAALGRIKQQET